MMQKEYEIVPFTVEACRQLLKDLPTFVIDAEPENYVKAISQFPNTAFCAIRHDGAVLGAGGIMPIWKGVGEGWVLVPPSTNASYGLGLHKTAVSLLSRIVEEYKLHRVQTAVKYDFITGHRWAKRLGFVNEGPLYRYGPDQHTYYRYAKLYPRS